MDQLLKDKVGIITGGCSGMGKAGVELFSKSGGQIVIADINEKAGIELENKLKSESDSVRKEIGKLYDKTDELYKELEQVSILLDKAKETLIGKQVFK